MIELLVDFHQYKRIGDAQAKAQSASDKVESLDDYIKRLEGTIMEHKLLIQALCEVIIEKEIISKEKLLEKIYDIDIRDGKADGKSGTKHAASCEKCGRSYSNKNNKCLYCENVNATSSSVTDDYKSSIKPK